MLALAPVTPKKAPDLPRPQLATLACVIRMICKKRKKIRNSLRRFLSLFNET